jgi:uncharacterized membrane-anchored protein
VVGIAAYRYAAPESAGNGIDSNRHGGRTNHAGESMKPLLSACFALITAFSLTAFAQDEDAKTKAFIESLHFKTGTIALPEAKASLKLNKDFRFLDGADADRVLSELWGNPPGSGAIGMLVPTTPSLEKPESWAVVITYNDDGFVSDEEASKIDYDSMLEEMQQSTRDGNEERQKAGYGSIELVGWAEKPHYDQAENKLYWAKDLKFAGGENDTLNYDIRVLGRSGYLSLNAVAGMDSLNNVKQEMSKVLVMAEFDQGARYADFNESSDKLAGYGIAALVGGAVAAKAGLFAKLFAVLLAAKKLVVVALVAIGAGIKKIFGKKSAS